MSMNMAEQRTRAFTGHPQFTLNWGALGTCGALALFVSERVPPRPGCRRRCESRDFEYPPTHPGTVIDVRLYLLVFGSRWGDSSHVCSRVAPCARVPWHVRACMEGRDGTPPL